MAIKPKSPAAQRPAAKGSKAKSPTAKAAAKPVRRKRRAPEEIRERLIHAAREEFKRCGFVGATTAAISRRADVTEAQLFRHFDSKADLFREAVFGPLNEHFSDFNARHMSGVFETESVHDQAGIYIAELQQFIDEHSKLLLSLIVSQIFTSGSLQVGEIESLRNYFERGAAMMSKRVNKNPQVDPKLLVRVSFAAVLGCVMFKDWIFPAGVASDDEIRKAIIDFVIDGINVNDDPGLKQANAKSGSKSKPEPKPKRGAAR